MSFDPDKVQRKLTLFGHACVLSDDYESLLAMYKALQAENEELKAKREEAIDVLARFFQDVKSSQWISEDERINILRKLADQVYYVHRVIDFTKARVESNRAVIVAALEGLKGEGHGGN